MILRQSEMTSEQIDKILNFAHSEFQTPLTCPNDRPRISHDDCGLRISRIKLVQNAFQYLYQAPRGIILQVKVSFYLRKESFNNLLAIFHF
jgi:hypothetical protein